MERERGVGRESARGGTIPSRSISKSFPQTSLLLLSIAVRSVWGVECGSVIECEGVGGYSQILSRSGMEKSEGRAEGGGGVSLRSWIHLHTHHTSHTMYALLLIGGAYSICLLST